MVSAGTLMTSGNNSPPDAITAADELGVDLRRHRSRPASPELLSRAERIYVMDRSHLDALAQMGFEAELLDPGGTDIADPYGRGLEAYRTAYRAITAALDERFGT